MIAELFSDTKALVSSISIGCVSLFMWVFRRNHVRIDKLEKRVNNSECQYKVINEKLTHITNTQKKHDKQNEFIIKLLLNKKE